MGGGSDDVRIFDGIFEEPGGNEAGGVGHVNPEDGAHFVGDGPHALIVPFAGVGRCTADNELGLAFQGLALHLVVVYAPGFRIEAIRYGMVEDAGSIHGRAVGEVTAHGQVQSHEGVAGPEDGHGHGHIGLGAGVRLDIGIFGVIQGTQAVDGQLLNLVHHLAAAVIAFAGVALGVFVGADGAHGGEHFVRYIILGSNEFQAGALPLLFLLDQIKKLSVFFHICG